MSFDGVGYDAEDPDECGPCSQERYDSLAYNQQPIESSQYITSFVRSVFCKSDFKLSVPLWTNNAEYAACTDQIAVFKRSDFKDQVDNGETLDPPTSELKLMSEYQSTESDPFAADVIHRWTVPQRPPDLR